MSKPPHQDQPLEPNPDDWIELFPTATARAGSGAELRGHGKDHHGVIPRGGLVPAGPDPTPVPNQDGWDF